MLLIEGRTARETGNVAFNEIIKLISSTMQHTRQHIQIKKWSRKLNVFTHDICCPSLIKIDCPIIS